MPPRQVVLRGDATVMAGWQRALATDYRPDTMVIVLADDWRLVAPMLEPPAPAAGGVNAYVCRGVECLAPVNSLAALRDQLASAR